MLELIFLVFLRLVGLALFLALGFFLVFFLEILRDLIP